MKNSVSVLLVLCSLLGCASSDTNSLFSEGSYLIQKSTATIHYIKFTPSMFVGPFPTEDKVKPYWLNKASEICEGDDYYYEVKGQYLGRKGLTISTGKPNLSGYVYCNTKFQDTREQKPDSYFSDYINLDITQLEFNDFTPLWQHLTNNDYDSLESELREIERSFEEGKLSEAQFNSLLSTFGRVNPKAEVHFDGWVASYPNSYMAHHAKSIFLEALAWHHRGNTYWKDVPDEKKKLFQDKSKLALENTEKAIQLNPGFFPSHVKKIGITLSDKTLGSFKESYNDAVLNEADIYGSVKLAYLRGLQPRWRGSKEEMRDYIERQLEQDKDNIFLEYMYLNDTADQLYENGEIDSALDKYKEALAYHSNAYSNRRIGNILRQKQKYVEAIQFYESALAINPYDSSTYDSLITVLLQQGNYLSALRASNYLVAMDSRSAFNFERQGSIYYNMRRYQDALISFQAADLIEPTPERKHLIRAAEFQIGLRETSAGKKVTEQAI